MVGCFLGAGSMSLSGGCPAAFNRSPETGLLYEPLSFEPPLIGGVHPVGQSPELKA